MRFGLISTIALFSAATGAHADRLSAEAAKEVLAAGKVISFAPVTPRPAPHPVLGSQSPDTTRIHEVFVAFEGEMFFCYLQGGKSEGVATYTECYD